MTTEDISKLAHEIYLDRLQHGFEGNETTDWLQAEKYLKMMEGLWKMWEKRR